MPPPRNRASVTPMAPGRFRLSWVLAATLAVYLLTLGVMLRWHWALGPPHTQASLSLMISFGLCAALWDFPRSWSPWRPCTGLDGLRGWWQGSP